MIRTLALLLAVAVNAGMLLLVHRGEIPNTPDPTPLRTVTIAPPDPTPPTPTPMTAAQSPVPSTPATVASLPRLDLPALSEAAAMPPLAAPTSAALPALVLPTLAPPTLALTATPPSPDIPASLLGGFDLERFYPREARARGWGGRTRLELSIDATGTVTAVRVIDSTPAGVFDEAARRLGVTLRFSPATRNGQALATRQPLLIAWTLQ